MTRGYKDDVGVQVTRIEPALFIVPNPFGIAERSQVRPGIHYTTITTTPTVCIVVSYPFFALPGSDDKHH